jgi:tRNA(Ile)-lysidine synthase
MHSLVHRVSQSLRQGSLLAAGDHVAVAVSGGPDSVALLHALRELCASADWGVAGVIHVNHQLRPEAEDDEAFVAKLAADLQLPIEITRVDVAARVAVERRSVEVVAREARYACFEQAAARLHATTVATGHSLDDQAETVLLRLLRGAGSRGLSGIRPRRGLYVRPLLACQRSHILDFLASRHIEFRDDASNASLTIARNRVRHQLLPVMAQLAPGATRALARFARLAADDEEVLAAAAAAAAVTGVRSTHGGVQIEAGWLGALPSAISRRILRDAIETLAGTSTLRDIDAILRLARADKGTGTLDLHRLTVARRGAVVTIETPARTGEANGLSSRHAGADRTLLPVPGRADLPETGSAVRASILTGPLAVGWRHRDRLHVALQADAVHPPLFVRHREPGDRFHPLGAPGTRRLQDLFVDRKIPRSERDQVPVVVDDSGQIVWVAGVSIAHHCRVTTPEAGMVILELEKGHQ